MLTARELIDSSSISKLQIRVDDMLDYGGKSAKLGKKSAMTSVRARSPCRWCCRSAAARSRAPILEPGARTRRDHRFSLETALGLMTKHRALEDTIGRAQHYGAIARDALALFPASEMKQALEEAVEFCTARTH